MDQREKNSVKIFLKPVADNTEVGGEHEPTEEEDYADRALRVAEQRKRRRVSASKCRSRVTYNQHCRASKHPGQTYYY